MQFRQLLIAVFQQCNFVSCWSQFFSNGFFDIKTIFDLQCFSNTIFWHQDYFQLTVFQQHKKKLLFISNKPTDINLSSSHRGIFTKDYVEEHLPLDIGITTGTLQFRKPIFYCLRKLVSALLCDTKKTLLYFYTTVCYKKGSQSISVFSTLLCLHFIVQERVITYPSSL